MRTAALYDIHGNLPALEAALADVRGAHVELIVIGGDVLPGPLPVECLDRINASEIPVLCIRGNGEREVLALRAGTATTFADAYRPVMEWVARQLRPDQVRRISSWPKTATVDAGTIGEVLFCHATPRSDTELFTRLTPDEQMLPLIAAAGSGTIVCGHTHMQFIRTIDRKLVVNAGSVGMPFGARGAYWLLLDGTGVELRRTEYDYGAAAARIRATGYPQASEFAANNVLSPPTEEQMLEAFARASAR